MPGNLEELIRSAGLPAEDLICEWDDARGGGHREGGLPSSFVYLGAGMREKLAPEVIVIYESPGIHAPDGMNALFGDGHVEYVTAGAQGLIKQLSAGHNPPSYGK
jgi:prepilin-type processing-associated H-X9-DG protein